MKIYINHFNLLVLPDLLKSLSKYKVKIEEYWKIYSSEGIYLIDEKSTFKLKPVDHDIIIFKKFYEEFTLIVDPSFFIIEKSTQIPSEHISIKIKREIFELKENNTIKQNSIKLVIESEQINESKDEYIPKDIYFELPNDSNINDALVKEELIVFLSLLN